MLRFFFEALNLVLLVLSAQALEFGTSTKTFWKEALKIGTKQILFHSEPCSGDRTPKTAKPKGMAYKISNVKFPL